MLNSVKNTVIILSISSLCACTTYNPGGYTTSLPSTPDHGTELYPEGYETTGYSSNYPGKGQVSVPESYHVSAYHPPEPSKNVDHQWVSSQSASGYTIEVDDSDKASSVANTLLKAPKDERKAEVKYQQGEKTLYKGVYGSYPTQEAAQQALQKLPSDLQQKANVKSWGSIQGTLGN